MAVDTEFTRGNGGGRDGDLQPLLECWFAMDLKNEVCHSCYLRDTRGQPPFLMSVDNEMDLRAVPAHLPVPTQVEEIIVVLFRSEEACSIKAYLSNAKLRKEDSAAATTKSITTAGMNYLEECGLLMLR